MKNKATQNNIQNYKPSLTNINNAVDLSTNYVLHYILLFLGAFLLYGWTAMFSYNLDDQYSISQLNSVDNTLSGILLIFKKLYVGIDYRPIPILSFWLERFLFGSLKPGISHIMNVFFFGIILIKIYQFIVISKFYQDEKKLHLLAFLSALIFLVHTNHVSVVANIKSRDNLLSMFFGLLSAIQFIKLFDDRKWWRIFLISFFAIFGFLSKLDCYIFLLTPILVIVLFRDVSVKRIALVLFSVIFIFIITNLIRDYLKGQTIQPIVKSIFFDASKSPLYNNDTMLNRISMACVTMLYYLKFLLIPFGYYFYYGYNQIPLLPLFHPLNLLTVLIYLSVGVTSVYYYKKNKIYMFCFLFFLFGIAYATNIPVLVAGIVMDRYNFIPSFGFCLAIAAIFIDLTNIEFKSIYKNFWLIGIVLVYVSATIYRTSAWKDQVTLFKRDIPHLQKSFTALRLMSGLYMEEAMSKATKKSMNNKIADENVRLANEYADKAIAIFDNSAEIWQIKGIVDLYNEDNIAALKKFQKCKNIDSNLLAPINYIGVVYDNLNQIDSAQFYYTYVMERELSYNFSADNLIELLLRQNKVNEVDSILRVLTSRLPYDEKLNKKVEQINTNKMQSPYLRTN